MLFSQQCDYYFQLFGIKTSLQQLTIKPYLKTYQIMKQNLTNNDTNFKNFWNTFIKQCQSKCIVIKTNSMGCMIFYKKVFTLQIEKWHLKYEKWFWLFHRMKFSLLCELINGYPSWKLTSSGCWWKFIFVVLLALHYAPENFKCEVKAAWSGYFTICLPLIFYVISNFGEIVKMAIVEIQILPKWI